MAKLVDQHNPSFVLLPVNNDRTAWRPYGLPVILVVPHRRDPTGLELADSGVWGVRVYVENVPREARVVGHDHVGMRYPDRELYAHELSQEQLEARRLAIDSLDYSRNGQSIAVEEARRGDLVRYRCAARVEDTLPYLPDADYYDLSDILLDVELLTPDRYNIVYQASYYTRQTTNNHEVLLCIDVTRVSLALLRSLFNHPGEVMEEFYRLTPPPYLTNTSKSSDSTVALYRPFTDILQDVADEQLLLQRSNWVHSVPYEAIPYLSALLGWDLPFFPKSLDQLRRVILRNTSYLQTMKGSRRAIVELFRLLGLDILLTNLWWSHDGKQFIEPKRGTRLTNGQVTLHPTTQLEPVLAGYHRSGFGSLSIPLLYRPQIVSGLDDFAAVTDGGEIVIDAYLVELDSAAERKLLELTAGGPSYPVGMIADPDGFFSRYGSMLARDADGQQRTIVQEELSGLELGGHSQIRLSGLSGAPDEWHLTAGWGQPPIAPDGIRFDRDDNRLSLTFNGYINFDGSDELPPKRRASRLYAFATYTRQDVLVPPELDGLQSNHFDIQLLMTDTTPALAGQKGYVDPSLFDFAFEFLSKIKAFHSLLNVLRFTVDLTETYEVTTTCVGGDILQRWDTDMGRLQTPPASLILPPDPGLGCSEYDPEKLGYKRDDIILRLRKLANLPEEFNAYKLLDDRDRSETYSVTGPRIAPRPPADRDSCKFTPAGQDRIVGPRVERFGVESGPGPTASQNTGEGALCPTRDSDRGQFDHGAATSSNSDSSAYGSYMLEGVGDSEPLCETDGISDYCYKGRVDDELLYRPTILELERYTTRGDGLGMGAGVYWLYPAHPVVRVPGTARPVSRSRTIRVALSGNARQGGKLGYLGEPAQDDYLKLDRRWSLPYRYDNRLGKLYRNYVGQSRQTLHYSDRRAPGDASQTRMLALSRPELGVEQPTMHFPGCRFPTLNRLDRDVLSDWRARPWDDPHSRSCGASNWCGAPPDWLQCRLSDDGQRMIFDDAPVIYRSNGLTPDVHSLGDHDGGAIAVVHSVLSTVPAGHPAISLDRVTQHDDQLITTDSPIFPSSRLVDGSTQAIDFADGYPGSTGRVATPGESADRHGYSFDVQPATALLLLGDGIQVTRASRLDAGRSNSGGTPRHDLNQYRDQDGATNWDADQVWLLPGIVLDESVGTGSIQLDGRIRTLFSLVGTDR